MIVDARCSGAASAWILGWILLLVCSCSIDDRIVVVSDQPDGNGSGGGCQESDVRTCDKGGALGNCAKGMQTCASGVWGSCSILPAATDTCEEGDDSNCNGIANEECGCMMGAVRDCAADGLLGACASGTETCDATGRWSSCSIQPAAADTCERGNDDNCNGKVNEGCPCTTGSARLCSEDGLVGKCANGSEVCDAQGRWGKCSIQPALADTCVAGNNDNCSGPANEGCLCIEGVTARKCGTCNDGTETCANGKTGAYGPCTGASQQHIYYLDRDGDGHGDVTVAVTLCGAPPAGYVASSDDCCDSDANAKPGQTTYFFPPRTGCGGFDYDCDGKETRDVVSYVECTTGVVSSCSACVLSTPKSTICGRQYFPDTKCDYCGSTAGGYFCADSSSPPFLNVKCR